MIVKVCGMRDPENIRAVEQTGADLMGFIFFEKSPRHVVSMPAYMPQRQKRVGVFVNSTCNEILEKARTFSLSYIQLHGNESPEFCMKLKAYGLGVIRAVGASAASGIARAEEYTMADFIVFDTLTESYGGSGRRFDWNILSAYRGNVPFLLSGGIRAEHLDEILAFRHPAFAGVDLNSGFETAPALKDAAALNTFIKKLKTESQKHQSI